MRTYAIATAPRRNSRHWDLGTVTWDEVVAWMETPASRKECGNYLFGELRETTVTHPGTKSACTGIHRNKQGVTSRSVIALDVDHPTDGFLDSVAVLVPGRYIVHPTFSSTEAAPRYRLLIPLDRDIASDEYHHAAEGLMNALGIENFDPGSSQPERYMFKPATPDPDNWWFTATDGPDASADELLADFEVDLSTRPGPRPHKNKRDPYAIEGTIGAFNRAYDDWDLLIQEYELPYERAGVDRWGLVGASAAAGLGPVADGLVYSHHANDPAGGVTCSAFDLVRLHRFGYLDEDVSPSTPVNRRPSQEAMLELASQDARVVAELVGKDFAESMDGVADAITNDSWVLGLERSARTGAVKDTIGNWDLIAAHDDAFNVLYFNELTMSVECDGDLPWREVGDQVVLDGGDRASFALYLEREYGFRPSRTYLDEFILDVSRRRRTNPVRDWLESLTWDGVPRVETALPGVRPTPYTRLVARKSLVAAVARMLDPGCKWDHMLVLYGPEGLGKSYWIDKMSRGYSASLGRIDHKDTLLVMQRSWIMTSDESHTMRQADFDAQKEFLTRTADVFRMPYDREAQAHPRHSVIWGTTNDEQFLRRQEGNRRFLIVHSEDPVDFDALTDDYIDQVWAEAVHLYRAGEPLFMNDTQAEVAAEAREAFMEEDALAGQILEYAETPVSADWDQMSLEARQLWLMNADDGMTKGTKRLDTLCSIQVWVETLGRRKGDHTRSDLLRINQVLKTLPGWKSVPGTRHVPGYGPQRVFVREEDA